MKKLISIAISFCIIWAIVFGIAWLVSTITGCNDAHGMKYYTIIGLSGAVGGLLGPIIANFITKKSKKQ